MDSGRRSALAETISVDSRILHGTPCFAGSRVPVQSLLDFLETGDTIDTFLSVYPSIPREQVVRFLELSRDVLVEQAAA